MDDKKQLCVIVPAKDESLVIASTLESLLQSGMSEEDIYVIDDGSSDGTGDIAKLLGVQVLRNESNVGKAHSVARLVEQYALTDRYEIIALMDADTRVNEGYFEAVKEAFLDDSIAVVCGQPKSRPHNWLTAYRSLGYFLAALVYRKGQSNMGVINVAPGCTTSYRASAFRELDWSQDTIVEDMDVTVQVHRKKLGKIVYQPKAIVYTQDPATLPDYIKQINRWNSGAWQVVRKYHMFKGVKKIDWEYKLLMGEGLLFGSLYLVLPIVALVYPMFGYGILLDFLFTIALSAGAGVANRRFDVFIYSPAYPFLRYLDSALFLKSFWNTYITRRYQNNWNSVKRYA